MISVIVPVFNSENHLKESINSILNQTNEEFELLLIDDGSTDDSGKICDEYAKIDSRIIVIHKENKGATSAINAGLDWVQNNSDSEWITIIDSDDIVHPQMLEILFHYANETDNKLIVGDFINYNDDVKINIIQTDIDSIKNEIMTPEQFYVSNWMINTVWWGKLYHRSCFEKIRYPIVKQNGDTFTTYKVIFAQSKVVHVKYPIYYYYDNPQGVTNNTWNPRKMNVFNAYREQIDFFEENHYKEARTEAVRSYALTLQRQIEKASETKEYKKEIKEMRKKMRHLLKNNKNDKRLNHKYVPSYYEVAYPINYRLYKTTKNTFFKTEDGKIKPLGRLFLKFSKEKDKL